MSTTTVELLGLKPRRKSEWKEQFAIIAKRLAASYGSLSLGNFRDPVKEIFYILLSAKTTDAQHRRTHRELYRRFPTLAELARGRVSEIRAYIASGGLARKRAAQIKRAARALIAKFGKRPAAELRKLDLRDSFDSP